MEKGLTTIKGLFTGDKAFSVPIYQRYYSWGEKQWDDLWSDLYYLNTTKKHYFGTILLKSTGKLIKEGLEPFDTYEIIDGQQRITTILILIKEIVNQLRSLNDPNMERLLGKIEEDYLRYETIYKLTLQGDDQSFFKQYIINNQEEAIDTLTNSQKRLKNAKLFFRAKLENRNLDLESYKEFLLTLKQKINDLEIILYDVDNDSDAVLIFETVNDRGKPLTNLEKTKSFLMHMVYLSAPKNVDLYLDCINERFSNIFQLFEQINNHPRGKNLKEDDIQRYHFVIYQKNLKKRLESSYRYMDEFKEFVKNLNRTDITKTIEYVLDYTKDLEKAFHTMKEIVTFPKEKQNGLLLHRIFILERIANFFPLLIALWPKYKGKNLKSLLKMVEIASFRIYAIGKRKTNAGLRHLYNMSFEVHYDKLEFSEIQKEFIDNFIKVYEDDKSFERDLKIENFYNKISNQDKKYLFYFYEVYLQKTAKENLELDIDNFLKPKYEIEHIWPNSTKKLHLSRKKEIDHDNYKNKLGNLTVATKPWNAKWQDSPFETKRKYYKDSGFRLQRDLEKYPHWGLEQIETRENQIIKFVLDFWKIPEISYNI
ncbi:DUF262 domain-containing protein [Methanobacterium formicicum]|uniref:DUF262 domain-containing protein n=1 Tax=Methanobacterium formicicum TaxID=2162 RepID=A0A843ARZ7_METFO|nr:DUF262 domain-containing HNH endonuclease family protein [Methanobacterium formicicum]MBF4475940.1 DUF262 domain-containing protein [Methanobacterium formicicum]